MEGTQIETAVPPAAPRMSRLEIGFMIARSVIRQPSVQRGGRQSSRNTSGRKTLGSEIAQGADERLDVARVVIDVSGRPQRTVQLQTLVQDVRAMEATRDKDRVRIGQ